MNKRHIYNEKAKKITVRVLMRLEMLLTEGHLGMPESCLSQPPFHTVRSLVQQTMTSRN